MPSHILNGRSRNSTTEPNFMSNSDNRLIHWQQITKYVQWISKSWCIDYLDHLQQSINGNSCYTSISNIIKRKNI